MPTEVPTLHLRNSQEDHCHGNSVGRPRVLLCVHVDTSCAVTLTVVLISFCHSDSMEYNPSLDTDSRSVGQDIPCLFMTLESS